MPLEAILEQMKRNGSIMIPNPWFHGPEKPAASLMKINS